MENIKYKEGDRVQIKSLDWYNENKDADGDVSCREYDFVYPMTKFCGKILTIDVDFEDETYLMKEDNDGFVFTSEMIEGLVADESIIDLTVKGTEVKERIEIAIPEGYEYVIESDKIVFTKKKKGYPKTYEECAEIIAELTGSDCNPKGCMGYMSVQLTALQKLFICRDAYWKIAGEEMGLGKPWEPDWEYDDTKYVLFFNKNEICHEMMKHTSYVLAFPTEEMRDAFYNNFKKEIEICKELL